MQMNNAWGVCAFLREMIRAAGTRAKPGRGRRAARTEGATARKDERRAPESPRPPGGRLPHGRRHAPGAGSHKVFPRPVRGPGQAHSPPAGQYKTQLRQFFHIFAPFCG